MSWEGIPEINTREILTTAVHEQGDDASQVICNYMPAAIPETLVEAQEVSLQNLPDGDLYPCFASSRDSPTTSHEAQKVDTR